MEVKRFGFYSTAPIVIMYIGALQYFPLAFFILMRVNVGNG